MVPRCLVDEPPISGGIRVNGDDILCPQAQRLTGEVAHLELYVFNLRQFVTGDTERLPTCNRIIDKHSNIIIPQQVRIFRCQHTDIGIERLLDRRRL